MFWHCEMDLVTDQLARLFVSGGTHLMSAVLGRCMS